MNIGNTEITNMVMIQDKINNKVLVQNRKLSWKGIAFPGGHLEANESIIESAVREVKEETGLDIFNLKFCGIIHWNHTENGDQTLIFYYKTDTYKGELISETDEGENFWVDMSELKGMKLSPGFEIQVDMFFNESPELFILYNDDELDEKPLYKWQ